MRLDTLDMGRILTKLGDVYTSPAESKEDVERLQKTWLDVLGDLPAQAIDTAVSVYLKSEERFFPKPGTIRRMAKQYLEPGTETLADRHAIWLRNGCAEKSGGPLSPCPVCGAVYEFRKRIEIYHDHQRHYETGIPYVGPPTGPRRNGCMIDSTQTTMETVR